MIQVWKWPHGVKHISTLHGTAPSSVAEEDAHGVGWILDFFEFLLKKKSSFPDIIQLHHSFFNLFKGRKVSSCDQAQ